MNPKNVAASPLVKSAIAVAHFQQVRRSKLFWLAPGRRCIEDISFSCDSRRPQGEVERLLAFLRTLVFAVLGMAVAIALAAPCMMIPRSGQDHLHTADAAAGIHLHHRHHHEVAAKTAESLNWIGSEPSDGTNQKRMVACAGTCCPLVFQAAMPDTPWSGTTLEFRCFDPIGIRQETGIAEPRPLRIERPPRTIG
ncbi:hypothetical protein [Methylobacterium oxalidis]|uniref:hypothetical protein n=1 Tax=Methylobacterium oxalidis TaxID=944322 RepID=UPI0033146C0F